jgi:hypothetical protein
MIWKSWAIVTRPPAFCFHLTAYLPLSQGNLTGVTFDLWILRAFPPLPKGLIHVMAVTAALRTGAETDTVQEAQHFISSTARAVLNAEQSLPKPRR